LLFELLEVVGHLVFWNVQNAHKTTIGIVDSEVEDIH
jgi:hypothetical protein